MEEKKLDFIIGCKHQIMHSTLNSHREGFARRCIKQPDNFGYCNSQTGLSINSCSQTAYTAITRLNAMVVKIMKIRPHDPSCMA
jgi:hypothetical protein